MGTQVRGGTSRITTAITTGAAGVVLGALLSACGHSGGGEPGNAPAPPNTLPPTYEYVVNQSEVSALMGALTSFDCKDSAFEITTELVARALDTQKNSINWGSLSLQPATDVVVVQGDDGSCYLKGN